MYATFNDKNLPVLIIEFSEKEPESPQEFQIYLDTMYTYYQSNEKLVIIFDATKAKYLAAEYRIMQGKWLKTNKDLITAVAQKMIFIIPSIAIQLLYKTILAIQPLPAPNIVVNDMKQALNEAKQVLVLT